MDEERREGFLDDRRRLRMNPMSPGNMLSNMTDQRGDQKQAGVGGNHKKEDDTMRKLMQLK